MSNRKADTIKVGGGADYAKVPERVRLFREANPNSKIITERIDVVGNFEGEVTYRASIWKDKATYVQGDLLSCDSSAESSMVIKVPKDKEKVETGSIGRALGALGYLANGEISDDVDYEQWQQEKKELQEREQAEYVAEQISLFEKAKTIEDLKILWADTNKIIPEIIAAKDKRKAELDKEITK